MSTNSALNELGNKLVMFEREILRGNATIANFGQQIDAIKPLRTRLDELDLYRKQNENYLEKYLPFFVQGQISETLHHCLSSTNKNKLFNYEEKKFKDFNNVVLMDTGESDLAKRMQNIQSILESTFKRYSKALAANSLGFKYRDHETVRAVTESSRNRNNTVGDEQPERRRSHADRRPSQFYQRAGVMRRGDERKSTLSQYHGERAE